MTSCELLAPVYLIYVFLTFGNSTYVYIYETRSV